MNATELRNEMFALWKQLTEAHHEFNNATGLYVDAAIYKIMHLEALRKAIIHDFEEVVKNEHLRATWIQK